MKWLPSVCGVFSIALLFVGVSMIFANSGGYELSSQQKETLYGGQKGGQWTIDAFEECVQMTCADNLFDCTTDEAPCPGVETSANGNPEVYECNQNVAKACHHRTVVTCVIVAACEFDGEMGCEAGAPIASTGSGECVTH